MMLSAVIAGIVLLLFGLAAPALARLEAPTGDGRRRRRVGAGVHLIALASLITAWPVLGAIGATARADGSILAIFTAPVLALLVLRPVARRLHLIARQQGTSSLPALVGARYGRSPPVAIGCALTAAAGLGILLIAEFKTVAEAAAVTLGSPATSGLAGALPVIVAAGALLAVPGRIASATGLAHGLLSVARVFAALALAVFVLVLGAAAWNASGGAALDRTPLQWFGLVGTVFGPPPVTARFITILIVATLAVYVLPWRLALTGYGYLTGAARRRTSLALLGLMIVLVGGIVLVASVGLSRIDAEGRANGHLALALSSAVGPDWMAAAIFIGIVAAATTAACLGSAVIGAAFTNDIMVPARSHGQSNTPAAESTEKRRVAIQKLIALSYMGLIWAVFAVTKPVISLADLGVIGLTGLALLAPPLVGGLYIRSIKHQGVIAGLAAGAVTWLYTLVIPALSQSTGLALSAGPFSGGFIGWATTNGMVALPLSDPLTAGMIWTLTIEVVVLAAVSVNTRASLIERTLADAFVDPGRGRRRDRQQTPGRQPTIRVGELEILLRRFLGDQVARETIREHTNTRDIGALAPQLADAELVRFAEDRLASVVGASSARWLLRSGSSRADMDFNDVARVLDKTADAVQFNRGMLRAALENSDQGISVIDTDLRLVTWNSRYLALFNYPPGLVRTGRHIAELIRYNVERGECGPGETEDLVQRRLQHLRRAQPHRFERHRSDGTVLFMTGNPIPGGGFVTSFNDITEFKNKQAELARANARLEARVAERTAALSHSNDQLKRENAERARAETAAESARIAAERANQSKTRFLAAASHDLLQPLNAARLFADAAGRPPEGAGTASIEQIQNALQSAQNLLEPLLDISKIDAGHWPVERAVFPIDDVLGPLGKQFRAIAEDAGLGLDYVASSAMIDSDPNLLRRIVQNLLANAIRYTDSGRVLLGVRRRRGSIAIEVHDTGPGIEAGHAETIFEEFERGDHTDGDGSRGLGLGLSLADRLCRLLGHRISVRAAPGGGATFAVDIACSTRRSQTVIATSGEPAAANGGGSHVRNALVVDDDAASSEALVTILESWKIDPLVATADDVVDIIADGIVDALIVDYDLGSTVANGLELIEACQDIRPDHLVLATANRDPGLAERARASGASVIYKPTDPARLADALGLSLTAAS